MMTYLSDKENLHLPFKYKVLIIIINTNGKNQAFSFLKL
jgi:hypothetical protein